MSSIYKRDCQSTVDPTFLSTLNLPLHANVELINPSTSQAHSTFCESSFRLLSQIVIRQSFRWCLRCIEMEVLLPILRNSCLARVKATHRDYLAPCIAFWAGWFPQGLRILILKSKATCFHLCETEFLLCDFKNIIWCKTAPCLRAIILIMTRIWTYRLLILCLYR